MGEPFSTASSAVGVISLGLQVCGQLVKYCQAWKACGDDIQRLGNRADSLRMPLERLQALIVESRSSDPEFATDLEEKAMQLEESVGKLQAKFDSYKPVLNASDFSGKVRLQIKKAAHSFRKEILNGMEDDLNAIEQTINTALNINMNQRIAKLDAIEEGIVKLVAGQENTLKLMEDMYHISMNRISARHLPPPPALFQSLCCRQAEQAQLICAAAKMESQIEREIQATDMSWPADHSWAMTFRRTQQRNRIEYKKKSFQYSSRLLNWVLDVSFSVSTGAGGLSLAPMLKIQTVYPRGSWQYKTISKFDIIGWEFISSSFVLEVSEYKIREFQVAFSEGKASPFDMFASWTSGSISLIDSLPFRNCRHSRSLTLGIYRVARFLGECGSIPDNCLRNGILGSICASFLWVEEDWPMISYLLDLGGPFKRRSPKTMEEKMNMQFIMSKDEDGVLCPSIISIILRESVDDLRSVLESKYTGPCDEVEGFSISKLLDLAIGWPQGIKVLMEFGADPTQITWSLMYQFQPEANVVESDDIIASVKILLNAGATVGPDLLRSQKPTWTSLVIKSMIKQRQELWELAQSYLLPEQIAKFDKSEDRIIDAQVGELHELLKSLGKPIPSSLKEIHGWVPGQSVYHSCFISTNVLDELYAYGFRDIDSVDYNGITPSMTSWAYEDEKWAWLASKGADWNQKLPRSNATVAHFWSTNITDDLFSTFFEWENFRSQRLRKWEKNFSNQKWSGIFLLPANQDECVCPCSPGGCTTLSVTLRSFRWDLFSHPSLGRKSPFPIELSSHLKGPEFRIVSTRSLLQQILGIVMDHSKGIPQAERIFIRALTFEGLGLKHACCIEIDLPNFAHHMKGRSEHEVNEILDEEKNRYEELEKLVLEFETAFTELSLPIWEFLTRHWQPRMIKYLSERDPYDKEHHEETRKIGVNLEVDDSEIPGWIHMLGDRIKEVDDEDS